MRCPRRNNTQSKQRMSVCFAIFLTVLMVLLVRSTPAAPSAGSGLTWHPTAAQVGDFRKALVVLAEHGHVAFVAEGVPLHPLLSPQDATKLVMSASLDDDVKAVAKAYDYTSERRGNLFILKKCYSDPDDLPALTWAECEHSIEEMRRISDPFNPHVLRSQIVKGTTDGQAQPSNPLLDPLLASLTPDQLDAMHRGKLPVSSLSPEQQGLVRRLVYYLYIQEPFVALDLELSHFHRTGQEAVLIRQDLGTSKQVLGYKLPMKAGSLIPLYPLSQFNGQEDAFGLVLFPASMAPTGSDPTDPGLAPVQAIHAQTLADAVVDLGPVRTAVDPAIAAKPVTLAGLQNAQADEVLRALADVYGLRLSNDPTRPALMLPSAPMPSSVEGLPSALRQTLPDPLARAMHMDITVAAIARLVELASAGTTKSPSPSNSSARLDVEETRDEQEQAMQERKKQLGVVTSKGETISEQTYHATETLKHIRITAIRKLRALVEPELLGKPQGLPLSALGKSEHEALATVLMVDTVQALLEPLTQPMSSIATQPDRVVLRGGVSNDNGSPTLTIELGKPMPDGSIRFEAELSGVIHNK